MLPMLSGCLVDDPPPYHAPQRTAPNINASEVTPRLDALIIASSGDRLSFDVPMVSEDAGQELEGRLFLDYVDIDSEQLKTATLPASTLDDGERTMKLVWKVRPDLRPGCHRFTLKVTHRLNWAEDGSVIDSTDLDEAYWFANINVTPQNANVLIDCPSASSPLEVP